MKKTSFITTIIVLLTCFLSSQSLYAQYWDFLNDEEDVKKRGYYDHPYKRYEAEPNWSTIGGSAEYLTQTFDQRLMQSEASNQQATQLNNIGDYVQWTCNEAADGMTIRFSIPDGASGGGTIGTLALYVNDMYIQDIELNSRWAWQYFFAGSSDYAHNEPLATRFPRMRFDEERVVLTTKISAGSTFKLEKKDAGAGAYIIDFVELEPIPVKVEKPTDVNLIEYTGDGSDLNNFIAINKGNTIYLPNKKYNIPGRLTIDGNNTKLIGSGMWHTQLHFTAPPNSSQHGFYLIAANLEISGFYITTENERRYTTYTSGGTGKAFDCNSLSNSKISDVWVTHFECGAWTVSTDNLYISNSRFRNNYADGINLAGGSKNSIVEHCSFRNNGDDDMASWSSNNKTTENNTYRYNTSENNWRAAAIGFFGGKQNKAYNILIIDPTDSGIRVDDTYPSTATFSNEGYFDISNISIYRAGAKQGNRGTTGDVYGNRAAAIHLSTSGTLEIRNFIFSNIDIYESKGNAVNVIGDDINNISLTNVTIDKAAVSNIPGVSGEYFGVYFLSSGGYNNFFCINFKNMEEIPESNNVPRGYLLNTNCVENAVAVRVNETIDLKYFLPEHFKEDVLFEIINGQNNAAINAQGIVTGLNEGNAQVKISKTGNSADNIIYTIVVNEVAVTGVSIIPATLTLNVGDKYIIAANVEPSNATNKKISWDSSNSGVVFALGANLTARSEGTATITVTTDDGKHTAKCTITVVPKGTDIADVEKEDLSIIAYNNKIHVSGYNNYEVISIYNLLGMKLYSKQLVGEAMYIDIDLQSGVYIVLAEIAGKQQKIIIHK
jgi:uncharacterized protein YjdB